jgi:16S rRNA (cytosine967-C5)-methyltransferase
MRASRARSLRRRQSSWRPPGRLVYSTCSIDDVENAKVVEAFLDRHRMFTLAKSSVSVPWRDGHDGAAAFLLIRS